MADVKKSEKNNVFENCSENLIIIKKVIEFLQLFMPVTLAKRGVAMVLLAAGIPTPRVTELTGLCDRSARGLLKSMKEKDATELLAIKSGSGQKSKTSGLESEIVNFHKFYALRYQLGLYSIFYKQKDIILLRCNCTLIKC